VAVQLRRVYTCPAFLAAAGYTLPDSTAERWLQCWQIAELIEAWTSQWFNVELAPLYLDGRNTTLVEARNRIPMQRVDSVSILWDRSVHRPGCWDTGMTVLASTDWAARERSIQRLHGVFPKGARNIKVEGAFGWVEYKEFDTVSTAALTAASTSLAVEDASGFAVRDVVEIIGDNDGARLIITGVDREANEISFDAPGFLLAAIEEDAVVRTFGRVPGMIEQLANYAAGLLNQQQFDEAGAAPVDPNRLKRERVDDYEYEYFDAAATGASPLVSGNKFYDAIIRNFSMPGVIKVIVP